MIEILAFLGIISVFLALRRALAPFTTINAEIYEGGRHTIVGPKAIHASAWFKDACLDRFYCICNCCSCCCGIEVMTKHGIPMMASSGYVATIDEDLCIACGECADCPFEAISVNEVSIVDWEKCMGCGVCVEKCNEVR